MERMYVSLRGLSKKLEEKRRKVKEEKAEASEALEDKSK